ncbi:hypothetical protein RLW55_04535 [Hyphomicrobium sp. B1]|jgi:hypothetical protein|uniref:hypothetical protein n=1 Tax=Hyphomicrobiales TaxID=356 RepID=UPI000213F4EE|nr:MULTISPECIES: hypothetical protein [unclassified Hyphomicrobium]CCB68002.1 conserved exported protein of unknown function [Hyphomicrobium sp. MC1]
MKTTLRVAIAAAAVVLGAGFANAATVSSDVHALKLLTAHSSAAQDVYWRRWHHRHRHCWWRHGHRFCRWW